MSKHRPQYLVSTDSLGLLGRPEQFINLWQDQFQDGTISGVELIAFRPFERLKNFIYFLEKNQILVISIHGKTGGESRLKFIHRLNMTIVNSFIFDVDILLDNFPKIEFLSHAPYFEQPDVSKIIFKKNPNRIWIENHIGGNDGIKSTIEQINLYRKNNINAVGMLDVFHFVSDSVATINQDWNQIVSNIKSIILQKDAQGKRYFFGLHFPIGTRLDDSLPIDSMTDEMLILFADEIIPLIDRVVFENQQKQLGLFFSTISMLNQQKQRNKRIISRLKKTGIIR